MDNADKLKVLSFEKPQAKEDTWPEADVIDIIDNFKGRVVDGEVDSFFIVGITKDGDVARWQAGSAKASPTELIGALEASKHVLVHEFVSRGSR